jgi:hypothetical protein
MGGINIYHECGWGRGRYIIMEERGRTGLAEREAERHMNSEHRHRQGQRHRQRQTDGNVGTHSLFQGMTCVSDTHCCTHAA